ncbi:M48 family metalloprotease [Echinicola jeungdonensis]|uniref:M48 family metalloprotease n=1 Tax=Echinicola jeungdonensis TaxID=709343 RepID=A0ABV5J8T9_9BACT|nr:M48 family metalloprotease [Echinicola jeungdonensis]MDN3669841.1 M48 family metalloprotease [Echinicola jeungdonensis]
MRGFSLLGYCLVAFFIFSCSRNPVTGKKELVLMSEKQEVAIGKEADPQITATYGVYDNPDLQAFIQTKGDAMAKVSHRSGLEYHFKILDSPVVNAFALPGGYVYFTRGIMAHFNSEAEFAGVLGHEIGHITARHGVKQHRNRLLGQLGLVAGVVVFPELGQFAGEASQGLQLLLLKFGRDAERQSDDLGVEYSSHLGYDASELADFFTTLERQGEVAGQASLPSFLSTHPSPEDRSQAVLVEAQLWMEKLNLQDPKVEREAYLKRIDGLVYGEDPRQGFIEGGKFYHPKLRFSFPIPPDWTCINSPTSVDMAPENGEALLTFSLSSKDTLEKAATELVKKYDLELINHKEIRIHGLKGLALEAGKQQDNMVVRVLAYLIQYGDHIYQFLGVSQSSNFDNYVNLFLESMRNFRELTDPDKLNRMPKRIQVITVAESGNLESILKGLGMPPLKLEEIALLNGMSLSDQIQKGTLIKIIGQ